MRKTTNPKRKNTSEQKTKEIKKIKKSLEAHDEVVQATPQPLKTKAPQKNIQKSKKQVSPQEVPKKSKKTLPRVEPLKKTLEWSSMSYLLTFPQWEGDESLEELLENLHKFWNDRNKIVVEAIICIEQHGASKKAAKGHQEGEDPGRHIHMCFKLDKKHCIKNPAFFDELVGKHCNIQTCRDYKACQIYCNKDKNVITHNVDIDAVVESTKSKKGVKHETVARFVMEYPRTMEDVNRDFPGYMIQNKRKVSDYIKLVKSFGRPLIPYLGIGNCIGLPPATIQVASWLNNNLPPKSRPFKQSQLWLWGPSNMGKTSLRTHLSQSFKPFNVCEEDKWWSGFDPSCEIAFFEEFNGHKTLSQMKSFIEGSEVPLAQKGEEPIVKDKNIPCIILSNMPPEEVYNKASTEHPLSFQALITRLKVIHVTEFLNIPWNQPIPVPVEIVIDLEESEEILVPGTPPHREGSWSPKVPLIRQPASMDLKNKINSVETSLEEELETQVNQIDLQCSEDLELEQASMSDSEDPTVADPFPQQDLGDPYQTGDLSEDNSEHSETYRQWKRSKKTTRKDLKKNNK